MRIGDLIPNEALKDIDTIKWPQHYKNIKKIPTKSRTKCFSWESATGIFFLNQKYFRV